jgi:hypothetical protein
MQIKMKKKEPNPNPQRLVAHKSSLTKLLWGILIGLGSCKTISTPQYPQKGLNTFNGGYNYSILGFQGDSLMFLKTNSFWEINLKLKCLKKIDTVDKQALNLHLPNRFWDKQKMESNVTMHSRAAQKIYFKRIDAFWRGTAPKFNLILKGNVRNETVRFNRCQFDYIYDLFVINDRELLVIYETHDMEAYTWRVGWFEF